MTKLPQLTFFLLAFFFRLTQWQVAHNGSRISNGEDYNFTHLKIHFDDGKLHFEHTFQMALEAQMPQLKNLIAVMRFACIFDISFQRLYPNYFQVMAYFILSYSSWSVK